MGKIKNVSKKTTKTSRELKGNLNEKFEAKKREKRQREKNIKEWQDRLSNPDLCYTWFLRGVDLNKSWYVKGSVTLNIGGISLPKGVKVTTLTNDSKRFK